MDRAATKSGACADGNSDPRQSHVPVAIGQVQFSTGSGTVRVPHVCVRNSRDCIRDPLCGRQPLYLFHLRFLSTIKQFRQLSNIVAEQLGRAAPAGLIFKIHIRELLPVGVQHREAGVGLLDSPGTWETATFLHGLTV